MDITNFVAWALIAVGAIITFLVKPILLRVSKSAEDDAAKEKLNKKIYASKIIGMWLVIIGAAIIFIAGGMYGRK